MSRLSFAAASTLSLAAMLPAAPASAQFEQQSVQFFLAADRNGDERLTLDEFRTFIRLMADAGAPMSVRIDRLSAFRVAFSRVDANGDGLATPEELRAAESQN
ncbi:hypothetical protein K3728_18215 [Rhodobacteraceae bacterium M385]|nr:hypothetical protein K3728_18215 [Rhodobacteraceae bacterium M385]